MLDALLEPPCLTLLLSAEGRVARFGLHPLRAPFAILGPNCHLQYHDALMCHPSRTSLLPPACRSAADLQHLLQSHSRAQARLLSASCPSQRGPGLGACCSLLSARASSQRAAEPPQFSRKCCVPWRCLPEGANSCKAQALSQLIPHLKWFVLKAVRI